MNVKKWHCLWQYINEITSRVDKGFTSAVVPLVCQHGQEWLPEFNALEQF